MARILVVSFGVVPGADRHGVQLPHTIKALAGRFSVDVLTLRAGSLAYVERFHKARMLRVPVPEDTLAAQVMAFRRAVRRQLEGAEYDVVHFRDAWGGLPAVEQKRALRLRAVFDMGRSILGEARPADGALAAQIAHDESLCLNHADLVLVPTELGRDYLANRGRTERVFVVPPGVDVDRFDAEPAEPGHPPRVTYVGALAAGRGVRVLLRAFREVLERAPARLTLVGALERRFAEPLAQAIRRLGIEGHVEILGPVDNADIPRVIARATVCVSPHAADIADHPTAPFPTKILEYAACGRALVAPRRTSVNEVIDDRVEGLLFEPGNPRDLAGCIVRLLADEELRERLAAAARRRVREHFPASATRRRLLDAYTNLVPSDDWNPLSEGASPVQIPAADGATTGGVEADELVADTSPELAGEPTPAAAMSLSTCDLPPPRDTEPWMVVTHEVTPARARRRPAGAQPEEDGTPAEGTEPPAAPPLGVAFAAGEVEVGVPRPGAEQRAAAQAQSVEVDLSDDQFVAVGTILGGPATAAAEPEGAAPGTDPERTVES